MTIAAISISLNTITAAVYKDEKVQPVPYEVTLKQAVTSELAALHMAGMVYAAEQLLGAAIDLLVIIVPIAYNFRDCKVIASVLSSLGIAKHRFMYASDASALDYVFRYDPLQHNGKEHEFWLCYAEYESIHYSCYQAGEEVLEDLRNFVLPTQVAEHVATELMITVLQDTHKLPSEAKYTQLVSKFRQIAPEVLYHPNAPELLSDVHDVFLWEYDHNMPQRCLLAADSLSQSAQVNMVIANEHLEIGAPPVVITGPLVDAGNEFSDTTLEDWNVSSLTLSPMEGALAYFATNMQNTTFLLLEDGPSILLLTNDGSSIRVASNIPFPFCDKWKLCIKKGVPTTFLLKEQDAPIFYGVITPEKDDCCWVRLDLTKEQSLTAWVQAEDDRVLLTLDPCGDDFTVPENAEYPEKWSMAAKDTSDSE